MNKKVIPYFLTLTLILASLAGCNQKNQRDSSKEALSDLVSSNSTEFISSDTTNKIEQAFDAQNFLDYLKEFPQFFYNPISDTKSLIRSPLAGFFLVYQTYNINSGKGFLFGQDENGNFLIPEPMIAQTAKELLGIKFDFSCVGENPSESGNRIAGTDMYRFSTGIDIGTGQAIIDETSLIFEENLISIKVTFKYRPPASKEIAILDLMYQFLFISNNTTPYQLKSVTSLDNNTSTDPSSDFAVSNNSENTSSSIFSSMFQYKAAETATTLDIMKLVETLPAHSTVEEVMDYDKSAYLGGEADNGTIYLVSKNRNLCGIDGLVLYTFFSDRQLSGVLFQTPNVSFKQYLKMISDIEIMTKTKFATFKGSVTDVTYFTDEKNADLAYTDSELYITTETDPTNTNVLTIDNKKNYGYFIRALIYGKNVIQEFSQRSQSPVTYGDNIVMHNEIRIVINFPGQT